MTFYFFTCYFTFLMREHTQLGKLRLLALFTWENSFEIRINNMVFILFLLESSMLNLYINIISNYYIKYRCILIKHKTGVFHGLQSYIIAFFHVCI